MCVYNFVHVYIIYVHVLYISLMLYCNIQYVV